MNTNCSLLFPSPQNYGVTTSESYWSVNSQMHMEEMVEPRTMHNYVVESATCDENIQTPRQLSPVGNRDDAGSITPTTSYSTTQPVKVGDSFRYRSQLVANIQPIAPTSKKPTKPSTRPKSKGRKENRRVSPQHARNASLPTTYSDGFNRNQFIRNAHSSSSSSLTPEPEIFYEPERPYSRASKPWTVDSQWSPATGRLIDRSNYQLGRDTWHSNFEPEVKAASRHQLQDYRSHFFGPQKRRTADKRERNRSSEPVSARDSSYSKKSSEVHSHSAKARSRANRPKDRTRTSTGIELSNSLCENCGLSRLHLKDVCLYCKQPRVKTRFGIYSSLSPKSAETISKTEFLRAAASGLGEFTHSSDEERNDGMVSLTRTEDSSTLELVGKRFEKLTHHKEIKSPYDPLNQGEDTKGSHKTSNEQMNAQKNRSSSGSSMTGHTKRLSTYHRPKLPISLTEPKENGREIPHVPPKPPADLMKKSRDMIINRENIVAELERRSQTPANNVIRPSITLEDMEVSEALDNVESCKGMNPRLHAILKQRNNSQMGAAPSSRSVRTPEQHKTPDIDLTASQSERKHDEKLTNGIQSENAPQSPLSQQRKVGSPEPTSQEDRKSLSPDIHGKLPKTRSPGSSGSHPTRSASHGRNRLPLTSRNYETASFNDQRRMTGKESLQRRMAYDPQVSIQKDSARDTSTCKHRHAQAAPIHGNSHRTGRRRFHRTAPVDTADCLAAIDIVRSTDKNIPERNTDGRYQEISVKSAGLRSRDTRRMTMDDIGEVYRGRSSRCSSAQAGSISSTVDRARNRRKESARSTRKEVHDPTKDESVTGRSISSELARAVECWTSQRTEDPQLPKENGIPECNGEPALLDKGNDIQAEQPRLDVTIDSVRYKTEQLTELVVRLRKRIQRDFAELGSCSPGDDVFGEEAVGATLNGQSTGMDPTLSTCLQNLRILEFNTHEIFNLLYPMEIDVWEPELACIQSAVPNSDTFAHNEAKGRITRQISEILLQKCQPGDQSSPQTPQAIDPEERPEVLVPTDKTTPS